MNQYLDVAIKAARTAGALVRENFGRPLKVNVEEAHDIKLELDVRSQALITEMLLERFPDHAILGEEGCTENAITAFEWVLDPIDGTVNYFYGIPHFCISIALREKGEIIVGVIYDPMRDELWHAELGGKAYLNDRPVEVSQSTDISQSVISVGMSKTTAELEVGLSIFQDLLVRARKCRMMGSAALDLNNFNLTVSSYVTIVGTLTARGGEQINVGGNWDNTNGWFNAAQSTVTFNGTSGIQQLISGGTKIGRAHV